MSELRVAVIEQPNGEPVFRPVDRPVLAAGSALISVLACALDTDDLRLLAGEPDAGPDRPHPDHPHPDRPGPHWPLSPGRYFVGAVESLGAGFTEDAVGHRLRPGTPVLVPSVVPCGVCVLCRAPPRPGGWCLAPRRFGRAAEPTALSGGLAEAVLVTGGAIHALPLTMPTWLATLAEPFASCLLAFARAQEIGRFRPGASVVIAGRDATTLLAVVAALELGAGRVVVVGGPDVPFLRLARQWGAEATIDTTEVADPAERIAIVTETVGGRGADLVLVCDQAPSAGAEACAMLREGGALVAMASALGVPTLPLPTGPFPTGPLRTDPPPTDPPPTDPPPTDPTATGPTIHRTADAPGMVSDVTLSGSSTASRSLITARQLTVLGVAGFAGEDIPVALAMLYRARLRHDFAALHAHFPFTPPGIAAAFAALRSGATLRALVVQRPDIVG